MSNLLASLGHTGRRVVVTHALNTQTLTKTKKSHNVLSKFTILCWAAFIAILGHMQPKGCGLDNPGVNIYQLSVETLKTYAKLMAKVEIDCPYKACNSDTSQSLTGQSYQFGRQNKIKSGVPKTQAMDQYWSVA